jgi:hypothetical protein
MRISLLRIQAMETKRTSVHIQVIQVTVEVQSNSSWSRSWILGAILGKIYIQDTYGLRFL